MKNLTTLANGTTFEIIAEIELTGKAASFNHSNLLMLKKPNGSKEFTALRTKAGVIELV